MGYGVMFHHFYNDNHCAGQGAISTGQLVALIEYLGREKILSAREWFDKANRGELTENDICLTFDDALLCQYDIALPVLQDYSISAFWFVYSSVISGGIEMLEVYRKYRTTYFRDVEEFYSRFFTTISGSDLAGIVETGLVGFEPEKYLSAYPFYSPDDRKFRYTRDRILGADRYHEVMKLMIEKDKINIREFSSDLWMQQKHLQRLHADGHIVGLHSHTHPTVLAELPELAQKAEYETNFQTLYEIIGEAPVTVSHPCNSYNSLTLNILKNMGIRLGFRANMEKHALSELEHPREDHINIIKMMN
jgi:peptidoglycan/xylan/chitin deacetylase (PgdA/CDA1 family)